VCVCVCVCDRETEEGGYVWASNGARLQAAIISFNSINQRVFMMAEQCAFCELQIDFICYWDELQTSKI